MADIRLFSAHRTWEDWLGVILGVLIVLSPLFAAETPQQIVLWNSVFVGALVVGLALLEFMGRWKESEEVLSGACGLWLIASPLVFGYSNAGELRYWHFALGAAVALLAALEFLQDSKPSDKKLSPRG